MSAPIDLIPDTPTARALSGQAADAGVELAEAPTCKPKRYITIDPDDPKAPTCKPGRYIIAPEPSVQKSPAQFPEWAREFGEILAESKR